jgi:hypothetical protein
VVEVEVDDVVTRVEVELVVVDELTRVELVVEGNVTAIDEPVLCPELVELELMRVVALVEFEFAIAAC